MKNMKLALALGTCCLATALPAQPPESRQTSPTPVANAAGSGTSQAPGDAARRFARLRLAAVATALTGVTAFTVALASGGSSRQRPASP